MTKRRTIHSLRVEKICTDIEYFVGWRVDKRVSNLGLSFLSKTGHLVGIREWVLGNLRKVKSLE